MLVVLSLREARTAIESVAIERSKHVERAAKGLPSINKARQVRAEISGLEQRVAEVRKETQRLKVAHDTGTYSRPWCEICPYVFQLVSASPN